MIAKRIKGISAALGTVGAMAVALLCGAVIFLLAVLKPLEARNDQLEKRLAQSLRQNSSSASTPRRAAGPAAKLAAFYHFFETEEQTIDWLAKLHALGAAAGVEVRSADYRMDRTGTRLERYEITMPITGNYAQIRAFLENALVEIPVLSLDQVSFRRQRTTDPLVQAEVRVTLHLVKS